MAVKFSNNAVTTLSADISTGATSFTVASASTFPTLGASDWTYVSINSEIVKIKSISGTTFALEDGTSVASSHSNGESVELRMTAELLNDFAEDTGGTLTGDLSFVNNVKAKFGANDDLQIYHYASESGSHSYITETGTGDLKILAENLELGQLDGTRFFKGVKNAQAEINYNGSVKLATTITGINVTGTVVSDGLTVDAGADGSTSYTRFTEYASGYGFNGAYASYNGDSNKLIFGRHAAFDSNTANDIPVMSFDRANGDISFYEDTGTTPKFFWDASAERLGIGTSSPSRKVSIFDSTNGYNLELSQTGAYNSGYQSGIVFSTKFNSGGAVTDVASIRGGKENTTDGNYGGRLSFYTRANGGTDTERLSIDSIGNVGIGTPSPQSKAHVSGFPTTASPAALGSNGNAFSYTAGSNDFGLTGGVLNSGTTYLQSGTTSSTGIAYAIALNPNGGNVGIGTSSPSGLLDLTTTSSTSLDIQGGDGNSKNIVFRKTTGGTQQAKISAVGDDLRFTTGTTTERMRIDSSGNVGIGTSNPQSRIDVGGGYMANEQGRTDHVANTMPSPYYHFDVGDNINLGSTVHLSDFTGGHTISAWIKMSKLPTDTNVGGVIFQNYAGKGSFFSVSVYGRLHSRNHGIGANQINSLKYLSIDTWYHVLRTNDGATTKLYIDGVLDTQNSDVGEWLTSNNATIGSWGVASMMDFFGDIIKLKVYNTALTADEVKELYSGASVPFKYKGASQTNQFTNPTMIDSNGDGQADVLGNYGGRGDLSIVTGNGFTGNAQRLDYNTTNGSLQTLTFLNTIAANKRTRISFKYRSSHSFGISNGNYSFPSANFPANTGIATDFSYEFTHTGSGAPNVYIPTWLTSAGEWMEVSDVVITYIGAVAEYDGSSATTSTWYDKSGNGLDGTVSGATLQNKVKALEVDGTLDVNDTGATDNAWNTIAKFRPDLSDGSAESSIHIQSYPSTTVVADRKAGIQSIDDAGTARPLILNKDGGNVGIGTSPDAKFHVLNANVGVNSLYATAIIENDDAQLDLTSSSAGTWGSSLNLVEGNGATNTNIWSIARTTSGVGNNLRFNFGTGNYHDNNTKMSIDSSGRVTMPYQPAFFAMKNGHLMETTGETTITGWNINVNVGSHFVSATGRFTAPVAGRYVFLQCIMSGQTSGDVQFRIMKNGSNYANSNNLYAGGMFRQTTVTAVVDLAVNDYVTFNAYSSTTNSSYHLVYSGSYSHISGYLLG